MTNKNVVKAIKGSGTIILFCSCSHKYQDERYGKQMRLHNKGKDCSICTVCGDKKNK